MYDWSVGVTCCMAVVLVVLNTCTAILPNDATLAECVRRIQQNNTNSYHVPLHDDNDNCTGFGQCGQYGFHYYRGRCPAGLFFRYEGNSEVATCDWARKVNCSNDPCKYTRNHRSPNGGQQYGSNYQRAGNNRQGQSYPTRPDPKSCNHYYSCKNGKSFEEKCPLQHRYDPHMAFDATLDQSVPKFCKPDYNCPPRRKAQGLNTGNTGWRP